MQDGLSFSGVDEQFNIDLFVLARYLEACYRTLKLEQPSDVSLAWGEANMAVSSGKVASLEDWCRMVKVRYLYAPMEQEDFVPSEDKGHDNIMQMVAEGHAIFVPKKVEEKAS